VSDQHQILGSDLDFDANGAAANENRPLLED
jgi:hypothetical protein